MAITLRFIWYHKVLGKQQTNIIPKKEPLYKVDEVALANVDDDKGVTRDGPEPDIETNKVSKLCGKYRGGTCLCKVKHTWKECLRKKLGSITEIILTIKVTSYYARCVNPKRRWSTLMTKN